MRGDYKYEMQMLAEEQAEAQYGCDFYDLTPAQQYKVFSQAETTWAETKMNQADLLRDRLREEGK